MKTSVREEITCNFFLQVLILFTFICVLKDPLNQVVRCYEIKERLFYTAMNQKKKYPSRFDEFLLVVWKRKKKYTKIIHNQCVGSQMNNE